MSPAALLVLVALGAWFLSSVQTSAQHRRHGRPARNPYNRRRRRRPNPRLRSLDEGGTYGTILIDPPWGQDANTKATTGRLPLGYETLPVERIARLPVGKLAAPKRHLYVWATNGSLEPAYRLLRGWGFNPRTVVTWAKPGHGAGHGLHPNTEHLVVGARGGLPFRTNGGGYGTWYEAPRPGGVHTPVANGGRRTQKPELFRELIEKMSPGPRLELFAREGRPGWDVWGKQARAARNPRRVPASAQPNPYTQACALPGGHVYDFAAGGRCQCCGRMAPKRTVELESRTGEHARYGSTCAGRSIGTTRLRTNQLEHMDRQAGESERRAAFYRGTGRGPSGIQRPTFARGWSEADIAELARTVGVSPFEPNWWLSGAANLVPGHYQRQRVVSPSGEVGYVRGRLVPPTGEYRRFVLEGGQRGRKRQRGASARSTRPSRARAVARYDDLPF